MGFEPTIFGVTGQYVNRYTTGPQATGPEPAQLFECMTSEFRCQYPTSLFAFQLPSVLGMDRAPDPFRFERYVHVRGAEM